MSERKRFNSEQDKAYGQLRGFFGRAESEFPAAAGQLINVVGGLVGDQQTTRRELQAGMGNIDIGLALIGDWLKETGAEGFDVKLGLGGGAKKAIGRSQVQFPTVSDLIRIRGRVNPELQVQIPPLLSLFSRQIRGGLDVGLSARQIVGGLVAESVGSRLSANGSANLREALNKPLAGHFEWIREALKIPDVAGQSGFKPVPSPEDKPAAAPKPLPEAVIAAEGEAKAEANLTFDEKAFVDILKGLVWMENSTGPFEARKLQQYFQDTGLFFSGLPLGGQLRAEVMKNVNDQLGAEGERLKKVGKTEAEIFDEWLKQIFIPLYRRAEKGK